MFKSALKYTRSRWGGPVYTVNLGIRDVGWVVREGKGWRAELYTGDLYPAAGRGASRDAAVRAAIAKVPADAGITGPVGSDLDRVREWANGGLLEMVL